MAPDAALTSANPLRQVTGASFGVPPVKQAPAAGPSLLRVTSPPLPAQAAAWLASKHPRPTLYIDFPFSTTAQIRTDLPAGLRGTSSKFPAHHSHVISESTRPP